MIASIDCPQIKNFELISAQAGNRRRATVTSGSKASSRGTHPAVGLLGIIRICGVLQRRI
jgi:hypothetical protein